MNVSVYIKLAVASIKSRMEYRASFFIFVLTVLTYYSAQIATIGVIITRFKTIGGWEVGDMAFLYSLLILSQSNVTFLFSGLLDFSNHVREGTYDRFLIRPISTLGQIIMGGFEMSGFAHVLMGIATFIFANSITNINWSILNSCIFLLVIMGGSMILASIRIIIATIAFYSINNQALVHLFVFSSREFLLYPINIYRNELRLILTFIIPLGFINFYPAHYFLDKTGENLFHPYIIFGTFPVGIVLMTLALFFWRKGQKDYESAGA